MLAITTERPIAFASLVGRDRTPSPEIPYDRAREATAEMVKTAAWFSSLVKDQTSEALRTASLKAGDDDISRTIRHARELAVARPEAWLSIAPEAWESMASRLRWELSESMGLEMMMEFIDEAISRKGQDLLNVSLAAMSEQLVAEVRERVEHELVGATAASVNVASQVAVRRLQHQLKKLDERRPMQAFGLEELGDVLSLAVAGGVAKVDQLQRVSDLEVLMAQLSDEDAAVIDTEEMEKLVRASDFSTARFDGGLDEFWARELERAESNGQVFFDATVAAQLDAFLGLTIGKSVAPWLVETIRRFKGSDWDSALSDADEVRARTDDILSERLRRRDQLALGPYDVREDDYEKYVNGVLNNELAEWMQSTALGPPRGPDDFPDEPGTADPTPVSAHDEELLLQELDATLGDAAAILSRAGIELAGVLDEIDVPGRQWRNRDAIVEIFELAAIMVEIQRRRMGDGRAALAHLVDLVGGGSEVDDHRLDDGLPDGIHAGTGALNAVEDSLGDKASGEFAALVYEALTHRSLFWGDRYGGGPPRSNPDVGGTPGKTEEADYVHLRRRLRGQESPDPIVAGGLRGLLKGIHGHIHSISDAFKRGRFDA